ncbi:MAG: zinc ribbon domain-containing protein [Halanaerobiales bacterium]
MCQSCGMEMPDEILYGKNADGSKNYKYCKYCYPDRNFSKDESLKEMVESCIPFRIDDYPNDETARASLLEELSQLERWKR